MQNLCTDGFLIVLQEHSLTSDKKEAAVFHVFSSLYTLQVKQVQLQSTFKVYLWENILKNIICAVHKYRLNKYISLCFLGGK